MRARVVVSGQVQGVGFRQSCGRQAASAGVTGWVRNESDGTVLAVLEGPDQAVAKMIDWCRRGPGAAQVTSVEVTEEPPEGCAGFDVR